MASPARTPPPGRESRRRQIAAREKAVTNQELRADQIRIAREGRGALVRRVAVIRSDPAAGSATTAVWRAASASTQRVSGRAEVADAEARWQGRHMKQNAGGAFHGEVLTARMSACQRGISRSEVQVQVQAARPYHTSNGPGTVPHQYDRPVVSLAGLAGHLPCAGRYAAAGHQRRGIAAGGATGAARSTATN